MKKRNKASKSARFRYFIFSIPWIAVVSGILIGLPLWWIIQRLLNGPEKETSVWEFVFGIILGGLFGWVIPEVINLGRTKWMVSHPLRQLLYPFCVNDKSVSVYLASLFPKDAQSFVKSVPFEPTGTFVVTPKYSLPWVIAENDALALGYLMSILSQSSKTENIEIKRDDMGINDTDVNMICIGSIKSNHKTNQINSGFKNLPIRFVWDKSDLTIQAMASKKKWSLDGISDFGILMKIKNEYNPSTSILVIAGISSYGTAGSAYFLWKHWRELLACNNDGNFALVVKIPNNNVYLVEKIYEYY
jgi:hypothetical protein